MGSEGKPASSLWLLMFVEKLLPKVMSFHIPTSSAARSSSSHPGQHCVFSFSLVVSGLMGCRVFTDVSDSL